MSDVAYSNLLDALSKRRIMYAKYLPVLALAGPAVHAVDQTPSTNTTCEDLTFFLNVTSSVKAVGAHPDLSPKGAITEYQKTLTQAYINAPNIQRNGTYTLIGRYCPANSLEVDRKILLQILSHGSTYTKEYWDRGAWLNGSIENSWVHYAHTQGYATLAIDRLCNGASQRPDPQLDCQLSTAVESFHALIAQIRSGKTPIPIPTNITYVGHSAGSIVGSNLAQAYPGDIETLVLTGWPSGPIASSGTQMYYAERNLTAPAPPASAMVYEPAAMVDPERFGVDLDQGYILSTNASGRSVLYAGDFDPQLPMLDFNSRGTSALGEASYTGMMSFPAYKGRVLVVTGDLDGGAWGDKDVIWRTSRRWPAVSRYEWIRVPRSGHDVNWHRAGPEMFVQVFEKLREGERRSLPSTGP